MIQGCLAVTCLTCREPSFEDRDGGWQQRQGRALGRPCTTMCTPAPPASKETSLGTYCSASMPTLLLPSSARSHNHLPPGMDTRAALSAPELNALTVHQIFYPRGSKSLPCLTTHVTEVAIMDFFFFFPLKKETIVGAASRAYRLP